MPNTIPRIRILVVPRPRPPKRNHKAKAIAPTALLDKRRKARQISLHVPGISVSQDNFDLFEAHPGSGGWMQAIVAVIAIVAVYFAATIPVRAEARSRETERSLRAQGMALLLLSEIIVLKGEIETYIESGDIYDAPGTPPVMLL